MMDDDDDDDDDDDVFFDYLSVHSNVVAVSV